MATSTIVLELGGDVMAAEMPLSQSVTRMSAGSFGSLDPNSNTLMTLHNLLLP